MAITITDGVTIPAITPLAVLGYKATRTRQLSTFIAINGQPFTAQGAITLRSGTLTFLFETEMDAFACEILHASGRILTYTDDDHPNTGMTYIAGSVSPALDDTSRTAWTVDVDYQEVAS